MGAGWRGGVRGPVEEWGALTLGGVALWELSILIRVIFTRLLALLAVWMWHRCVRKAVNGDVVDGEIGNG